MISAAGLTFNYERDTLLSPRLKPLLFLYPPARTAAVYLAISMLTFTDPGTLKTSVPPLIFAIGITPGEGIDSPSWW